MGIEDQSRFVVTDIIAFGVFVVRTVGAELCTAVVTIDMGQEWVTPNRRVLSLFRRCKTSYQQCEAKTRKNTCCRRETACAHKSSHRFDEFCGRHTPLGGAGSP